MAKGRGRSDRESEGQQPTMPNVDSLCRDPYNESILGIVAKAVLTLVAIAVMPQVIAKMNNLQGNDVECISFLEDLLTRTFSLLHQSP